MPGDVRRALHVDGFWGMVHAVSSRSTGVCRGLVPEPGQAAATGDGLCMSTVHAHGHVLWWVVCDVSSRPTGVCRGPVPEPGPRVVTESYLAEWVLKYSDMVVRLFMKRTDVQCSVLYCQSCSRRVRCTGRAWSCLVARDRVGSWGCSAALGGIVARGGTGASCRGQ